jgi:hypothetical protein
MTRGCTAPLDRKSFPPLPIDMPQDEATPRLGAVINRKEASTMRKIKVLGLMLVAIFAMSAVAATAASASELTGEEPNLFLHGTNEPAEKADVFFTTAGNTSCKNATYTVGTISTPTTTVTATPTYTNCTSLGFPATIDTNGCSYVFHVTGGSSTVGDVTLQCPENKEIQVTAISGGTNKCTVSVPGQTLSNAKFPDPVTYTNIGEGTTREVTIAVKYGNSEGGLKYSHKEGTGLGRCTTGSGTAGTFEGLGTVTANNDTNTAHRGLFLSHI